MNKRYRNTIPKTIKKLFWDTDKKSADIKAHKVYIIKNILNYGTLEDAKWMLKTYTTKEIIEVLEKSRGISKKSVQQWATYYNIPEEKIESLKS